MDIEQIGLTKSDFDLINEALENLPSKGASGSLMRTLMVKVLAKDGPHKDEMEKKLADDEYRDEVAMKSKMEEIRLVQGKLIQLRRSLERENKLPY